MSLSVGGVEITHFNNVQISYQADDYGISGVMSQQLTFDVPQTDTTQLYNYGAAVTFTYANNYGSVDFPTFYIYSRKSGSYTCYDAAMFLEIECSLTEDDAITTDSNGDKYFATTNVINNIIGVSGVSGIDVGSIISGYITLMPKDEVVGKTCRDILSSLAESACGCFYVAADNTIKFIQFGGSSYSAFAPTYYSTVQYGLTKSFSNIVITNGSKQYIYGSSSADAYRVLKIDSIYASSELAGAVITAVQDKSYQAWSSTVLVQSVYAGPFSVVTINGTQLIANYGRLKFSAGCIAELGANSVIESEYTNRIDRTLKTRVKIGETNGNTEMDRDGIKYVYTNENSDGSTTTEKYGMNVEKGGITTYDGIMMSASPKSIQKVSDNEVLYIYDNYSIRVTADGTGDTRTNPTYEVIYND